VRGDGTINYPLIGSLEVAGRPLTQVDEQITGLLARTSSSTRGERGRPRISKSVGHDHREVRTPGRYVLKRNMRLIDLLAEAAARHKEAGMEILVTRREDQDGHQPRQIVINRDRS